MIKSGVLVTGLVIARAVGPKIRGSQASSAAVDDKGDEEQLSV